MKRITLLTVSILTLNVNAVCASDWRFINSRPSDNDFPPSRVHYDADSIKRKGGVVTVWQREVFESPAFYGERAPNVEMVKLQKQYDCDDRTMKIAARFFYDGAGNVLYSSSRLGEAKPIAPDSEAENQLQLYCSTKSNSR